MRCLLITASAFYLFFVFSNTAHAQDEPDFIKRVVTDGEYKLVDRKLHREKLKKYSPEDLRIVRNTIFARYGYIFKSADLRMHFEKFKWYKPSDKNTAGIKKGKLFSKQELENIYMIKELEDDIKAGRLEGKPGPEDKHVVKKRGEYWQKDDMLSYKQFEILLNKSRDSTDICPLTSFRNSKVDRDRIEYGNLLAKHLFLNYFKEKKLCRGIELEPGTCDEVSLKFLFRNFIEIDNKFGYYNFVKYDEVKEPYKKMLNSMHLRDSMLASLIRGGMPLIMLGGNDLRKVRPGSKGGDSGISRDTKKYENGMQGLYYLNIDCEQGYEGPVIKRTLILEFIPVDRKKNMPGAFFER